MLSKVKSESNPLLSKTTTSNISWLFSQKIYSEKKKLEHYFLLMNSPNFFSDIKNPSYLFMCTVLRYLLDPGFTSNTEKIPHKTETNSDEFHNSENPDSDNILVNTDIPNSGISQSFDCIFSPIEFDALIAQIIILNVPDLLKYFSGDNSDILKFDVGITNLSSIVCLGIQLGLMANATCNFPIQPKYLR